jgi:hypothetical protein
MVHGVSAIMVLLRFAETGHEKAITENLEMDGALIGFLRRSVE